MSEVDIRKSLFEEKSLSELLKVFECAFPTPLPAKVAGTWFGVLTFLYLIIFWYLMDMEVGALQKSSALIASYLLTVSSALMGVVIAGMSIFAASLKPKVASGLIDTPYPGTNISSLKFIFSMFAYVLFSLFLVIVACGIHYVLLGENSLVLTFVADASNFDPQNNALKTIMAFYNALLAGLAVFLGSLLKSFIWNLHQVLLVVAVYNGQSDD